MSLGFALLDLELDLDLVPVTSVVSYLLARYMVQLYMCSCNGTIDV